MSLISYFLVIYECDSKEAQKAGTLYIIMTHIGTAFITGAFVVLYKYTGQTDISLIKSAVIPGPAQNLTFILLLIGFGTKAGIIPLHIWLPYAHPASPSNVSAIMSGIMIKTAVYGLLRFIFALPGSGFRWWGTAVLIAGVLSAVLGVAYALMDHNVKRLLAYSSIENIGIIFIGTGLALMARADGNMLLGALALTAALLHILNHSIFKGLLFMGAGSIHYSTHTKDIEKLGGLIRKMPYTAVFFLVGCMAISALPPFNGFVSEWLTYQSLFMSIGGGSGLFKILIMLSAAALALAGVLAAFSFIKLFGIAFLAVPRSAHASEAKEVSFSMLAGMGGLSVLCALLGLIPATAIRIADAVNNELFGNTVLSNLSGFSSFILYPIKANGTKLSAPVLATAFLVIIALVFLIIRLMSKGTRVRSYNTWDCGYISLNSRMQYSATGFSKPLRIVFRGLFRPQRELQIEEGAEASAYHFKAAKYVVSNQAVFERYLYDPVVRNVKNFARRFRFIIQTGSVHTYLIYIFIAIIAMFIYYAKA
jgi:hydrogenase-4 component B